MSEAKARRLCKNEYFYQSEAVPFIARRESRAERPVSRVRSVRVGLRLANQAGTRSHVYGEQVKTGMSEAKKYNN